MASGQIVGIYVAPVKDAALMGYQKVSVRAGKGIEGDRYFSNSGKNRSNYKGQPDWEITLIEAEVIDSFNQRTRQSIPPQRFPPQPGHPGYSPQ